VRGLNFSPEICPSKIPPQAGILHNFGRSNADSLFPSISWFRMVVSFFNYFFPFCDVSFSLADFAARYRVSLPLACQYAAIAPSLLAFALLFPFGRPE